MPFQKGNKLASVQKGKPKGKNVAWENLGSKFVGDFTGKVTDIMRRLSEGLEVSSVEMKFLEEFKDLLEYFKPKLARTELTGKDGETLMPQPILDVRQNNCDPKNNKP